MRRRWTTVLVLLLAVSLVLGGCVTKSTYNKKVEELEAKLAALEDDVATAEAEKKQLQEQLDQALYRGWLGDRVLVYFIFDTGEDWYLVPVVRSIEFSKDVDPRRSALEELLAGPEPGSMLTRPLPEGVRVINLTVDENGLATVDLSREVAELNVGARLEQLAVGAVVNTLTEFAEIDRVQILVGGQTVETLAGHVDITEPLERSEAIVLD